MKILCNVIRACAVLYILYDFENTAAFSNKDILFKSNEDGVDNFALKKCKKFRK